LPQRRMLVPVGFDWNVVAAAPAFALFLKNLG
jgi:hypothetical protein